MNYNVIQLRELLYVCKVLEMAKTKKQFDAKTATDEQKQHTMTVRLDHEVFTAFDKVCNDMGYSKSFVVRELVKKYLNGKQQNLF